jgi:hypothetical protein
VLVDGTNVATLWYTIRMSKRTKPKNRKLKRPPKKPAVDMSWLQNSKDCTLEPGWQGITLAHGENKPPSKKELKEKERSDRSLAYFLKELAGVRPES